MRYLFVSDLHLDGGAPAAIDAFCAFLAGPARASDALYVLGDLFESWIGDDDDDPARGRVVAALAELARSGPAVFVMRGNRDFLLGPGFEARSGCRLLPDPVVATLHGRRVLLTHGDLLCTADHAYQELRSTVRTERFRSTVLALPAAHRRRLADAVRAGSRAHTASAQAAIMDVDPQAVVAAMKAAGVDLMIHGHTHRPATHALQIDGRPASRIVLDAWFDRGSVLEWGPAGPSTRLLEFAGR